MNDSFGLAAFRSRTQVLRMEDALHRAGLSAGGCPFGLTLRRPRR